MKRFLSAGLLSAMLFSQLQLGFIVNTYASDLQINKDQTIEALEKVETAVDKTIDKLDKKVSGKKKQRLNKKSAEIENYLKEVKQEISEEKSSTDIKALASDAQKVVLMKVVSGVTEYSDVTDAISTEVAENRQEISQASNAITGSLETESGDYSIFVKTKLSITKLDKLFKKLDTTITIDFLYKSGKQNYYEVFILKNSLFQKEMLEDISSGTLPKAFLKVEVITPEVFLVEADKDTKKKKTKLTAQQKAENKKQNKLKKLLTGEDLTQTWGVAELQTYNYFADTKKASNKIKIGVVDTGIDYNHPDLQKRVTKKLGRDFVNKDKDAIDDQGHGTHVAGTIAASVNKSGIIGVNPYTKLVPLKICDTNGFCPTYAVLRALNYAKKKKIDILNMSLGGRGNPAQHEICAGISDYVAAGGIVVAAAGNSNINTSGFVPGGCSDTITVGAHDQNKSRAVFSNYGAEVDIAAPGVDIYSTKLSGGYHNLSGTSMAAPHISGVVSLMQAYDQNITAVQAKQTLKQSTFTLATDRPISGSLNTELLVARLTGEGIGLPVEPEVVVTPDEEITPPAEEIVEENTIKRNNENIVKKADINKDITLVQSKKIVNTGKSPNLPDDIIIQNLSPRIINFGDESIQINSNNPNITTLNIPEIEEPKKLLKKSNNLAVQTFDEQGNVITDAIEINNIDSLKEIPGRKVGNDFDFSTIKYNSESLLENVDNTDKNTDQIETNYFFIGEKNQDIQINSINNIKQENIIFPELQGSEESIINDGQGNNLNIDEFVPVKYEIDENLDISSLISLPTLTKNNTGIQNSPNIQNTPANINAVYDENSGSSSGLELNIQTSITESNSAIKLESIIPTNPVIFEDDTSVSVDVKGLYDKTDASNLSYSYSFNNEDYTQISTSNIGVQSFEPTNISGFEISDFEVSGASLLDRPNEPFIYEDNGEKSSYENENENLGISIQSDTNIVFQDDMSDGLIDSFYARNDNNRSSEINGYIQSNQAVTDQASSLYTQWFELSEQGGTIEYDFYSHPSSQYYYGAVHIILQGADNKDEYMYYKTHKYSRYNGGYTPLKNVIEFGGRGIASQPMRIMGSQAGIHKQWVKHKIEIDIENNVLIDSINGKEHKTDIDLSNWKNKKMKLKMSPYGWWTGHFARLDNLKITKKEKPASIHSFTKKLEINIADQPQGNISLYVKSSDNTGDSNIMKVDLIKVSNEITPPSNLTTKEVTYKKVDFTWNDNSDHINIEDYFTLKDESNNVVMNNITANKTQVTENYTSAGIYSRKICAINAKGEYCSDIITFEIPEYEVPTYQCNISGTTGSCSYTNIPEFSLTSLNDLRIEYSTAGIAEVSSIGKTGIKASPLVSGQTQATIFIKDRIIAYIDINVEILFEELSVREGHYITIGSDLKGKQYRLVANKGGIASFSSYAFRYTISGLKGGVVDFVFLDTNTKEILKAYRITVIGLPKVEKHTFNLINHQWNTIVLPKDLSQYRIESTGDEMQYQINGNSLTALPHEKSHQTLHVYNADGFKLYEINLISGPKLFEYSINVSQTKEFSYHSAKTYNISNQSIPSVIDMFGSREFRAMIPGTVDINMYIDGGHAEIHRMTVLPKPAPIELHCETSIGSRCEYRFNYSSYTYTESHNNMAEIRARDGLMQIRGNRSGTITMHLQSYNGDYTSHILNITVLPNPLQEYNCDTPLGVNCETNWYGREGTYSYTTSKPDIVDFYLEKNNVVSDHANYTDEKLIIKTIAQGDADIYVYKNNEHTATFHVTILPPISPIILGSYNNNLNEGDSVKIDILDGGGEYKRESYDSEFINVNVDNNVGTVTGDVTITGVVPGYGRAEIKDKYGQTKNISIRVEDTILELSVTELTFDNTSIDTYQYVSIREVYQNIASLQVNNNNIEAYQVEYTHSDGSQETVIKVVPKHSGESILQVTDQQGNIASVLVTVSGNSQPEDTPQETNSKIRYIRDWANGSNKSRWNAWKEIEAINRSTGENIAINKAITGLHQTSSNLPYPIVTDGEKIDDLFYSYIQPNSDASYLTVDLGDLYDIEKINIWHYYGDGRTYNGTKTEVSADGVTWHTIFDSAVEGTYAEPTDGSGKTHDVKAGLVKYGYVDENNTDEDNSQTTNNKIQYIRDWANGSSKNSSSHWVEIQAFEASSQNNIAYQKAVTGYNNQGTTKYDQTIVVNGIIDTGVYYDGRGQGGSNGEWIQIDLGSLYDISTINVRHYYGDGRTYNGTKTEVSADGVTWHTIFDSAVEGTYAESTDGSGKAHDVKAGLVKYGVSPTDPGNNGDEIDIDIEFQAILKEFGFVDTEDNISISSTGISPELIEKIDKLGTRYINILNEKYSDKTKKIEKISLVINKLNSRKKNNPLFNAVVDYFNSVLQEHIEDYDKNRSSNIFDNLIFGQLEVHNKKLIAKIITGGLTTGKYDMTSLEINHGRALSKGSLDYLKGLGVVSQAEIDELNTLKPKADNIYQALKSSDDFIENLYAYDEGAQQAIKDYIQEYIDLIDPRDIPDLLIGLIGAIKKASQLEYEIDEILDAADEFYEIVTQLPEILAGLEDKKRYYYEGYVYTTVGLMLIPIKVQKFAKLKKVDTNKTVSNPCPLQVSATESINLASDCKRDVVGELKYWNKVGFMDKNTILGTSSIFTNTRKYYKKSKIYKNTSNDTYYYRDPAGVSGDVGHQHLEVYDKSYNHIGIADPITGKIDYSKAVSGRTISNIMK
ncbi:S8 family serine peptidase [Candidatus Gracilibacteria bacterium]|nr:S8 family serine peptidase [Candidatus Gracilibacteria bacterium]